MDHTDNPRANVSPEGLPMPIESGSPSEEAFLGTMEVPQRQNNVASGPGSLPWAPWSSPHRQASVSSQQPQTPPPAARPSNFSASNNNSDSNRNTQPASQRRHSLRPLLSAHEPDSGLVLPSISSWTQGIYGGGDDEASNRDANADEISLADFLNTDFSSPSSYPPFNNSNRGARDSQVPQASASTPTRRQALAAIPGTVAPRHLSNVAACSFDFLAPSRSATQLTNSTITSASDSQSTLPPNEFYDDFEIFLDSPGSSSSDTMPQLRTRGSTAAPPSDGVHVSKRRRTAAAANALPPFKSPGSTRRRQVIASRDSEDSLFNEKPTRITPGIDHAPEDLTTIDLTEVNEVPEVAKQPEEDNKVKISAFQCVICMDDVTTLTVTYCGKLSLEPLRTP